MTTAPVIDPQVRFAAAVDLHRRGEVSRAESLYREVLMTHPRHADALHLWGVARQQQARPLEAIAAIRRAIMLNPSSASYWQNLAGVYRSQRQLERAADCYREATRRSPEGSFASYGALGDVLQELERWNEAVIAHRRALELNPDSADVLNNLGRALEQMGRTDEAIAAYESALRRRPGAASILSNLGSALRAKGDLRKAIEVLIAAAEAAPNDPAVHHNLANAWKDASDFDRAEAAYRESLGVAPCFAEAHAGLAALHEQNGDCERASFHLARAIEVKPKARWRIRAATLLPPIYSSREDLELCRAALIENANALVSEGVHVDAAKEPAVLNFYLPYQGFNERALQSQLARLATTGRCPASDRRSRPRGRRICVGFLSRHFREHTIGRLFKDVIARLSREIFEVTVISVTSHDDAVSRLLRSTADRFVTIGERVPTALECVADLGLDVLCYTDLGMEPVSWTLAHTRLAPVQCAMWGHPITTGLPTIDYFLSSRLFEPADADDHYTERLVRFAGTGTHYERPRPLARPRSRAEPGLNDDRRLYGCPQSLFKIHPDFDDFLARILREDDRAAIVLLSGHRPLWELRLRERFAQTIGGDSSRIQFVPRAGRADFLSLLSVFDVILDPIHFGGGNTSLEALALGIPVVTLPSDFLRGRITAGLYQRMAMTDCVAADADGYVSKAIRLANDAEYRRDVQHRLAERSDVLFEDHAAIREMEEFLESAIDDPAAWN